MSVWVRNGIWYYQFRYHGKQYSGRANDAKSREEAEEAERERRQQIMFPGNNTRVEPIKLGETEVPGVLTITFILEPRVIKELVSHGTKELILKIQTQDWLPCLLYASPVWVKVLLSMFHTTQAVKQIIEWT